MIQILFLFAVKIWHKYLLEFQKCCQPCECNKPEVIAWLTPVFKMESETALSIQAITFKVCSSGNFKYPHIYITFTVLQSSVFHTLLRLPCGCRANWINLQFPRRLVLLTIHLALLMEQIVLYCGYSLKIKEAMLY